MSLSSSLSPPTQLEEQWMAAVKKYGCLCCLFMGYPHDEDRCVVEAHHLLSGGIRMGHLFTVGLCLWHHRGRLIIQGWNHKTHRRELGPSLAEGSKTFEAAFGGNQWLLDRQRQLLMRREPLLVDLRERRLLYAS